VFFYPKDDTPGASCGCASCVVVRVVRASCSAALRACLRDQSCAGCTKEACSFRDSYQAFTDADCEVVGISSDPPASHKAFAAKHRLPYTLLSDERGLVRTGFGIQADLFGMLPGRQTYVIGMDGKCLMSFNSQMDAEKHVTEALAIIKAAKR
jgi:peroxiredoxin Q/BCP